MILYSIYSTRHDAIAFIVIRTFNPVQKLRFKKICVKEFENNDVKAIR